MTIEHRDSLNMEVTGNMNRPSIDKMDPRYIEACIEELPDLNDFNEIMIRGKVEDLLSSTPEAVSMTEEAGGIIKNSFRDLYAHRKDPDYVHDKNQEYAAEFARATNTTIVSGIEYLEGLEKGKPVFFSANHDATFRMGGGLTPEELRALGFDEEHALQEIHYPHLPFYGAFQPVAQELGNSVCMAAEEEPGALGELYRGTGSLDVSPANMLPGFEEGNTGRVEILANESRELFEKHPNTAVTVFAEGATTGKRTGGNMRELGKFHSGLFAIAAKLEVPVVLLAYRFNPNKGFEVSIAGVVRLDKHNTREEIQEKTNLSKDLTQAALDKLYAE